MSRGTLALVVAFKAVLILATILLSVTCVLLFAGCEAVEVWLTTPDRIEVRSSPSPPPSP